MRSASRLFVLAAWIGLATGIAELAMRAVQKLVLHRIIYLSRDIAWMTPLADLLLISLLALLLLGLSRPWPRAASTRVAVTLFAFVGAWSILTLQPWMAWWAMVSLAFGVAVQVGRLAGTHEELVLRVARRTLPVLAALVAVFAMVERGGMWLRERRSLAALSNAAAGAPNVLMIVWDAVRTRDVSLYGYGRHTTPRLEAFAATGVTFERAMSTASYTLPAHASLFTGRWAHQLSTSWETPLDDRPPTLAEALAARGYRTGAFSANHILVTWEQRILRGFAHTDDYVVTPGEVARSAGLIKWFQTIDKLRRALGWYDVPGRRNVSDIRASFLSWLARGDPTRPFFAFLNVYDAHDPYLPPAPFDSMFGWTGGGETERRRLRRETLADRYAMSPAEVQRQRDQYDGAIAEADHDFGLLLDELERRGLLRNTIVVLAGDHGEAFGEHRTFVHGNDVYAEEIHVPLVIALPGRSPAGARVRQVVSLRDVPATIAELLGQAAPAWPLPGHSLARLWRDSAEAHDTVLAEIDQLPRGGKAWVPVRRGAVQSIIVWPHQLITTGAQVELYDLAADSMQRRSLAGLPAYAPLRDSLAAALRRWRRDAIPAKL